ncbi:hypothetical protein EWM64_g3870 [Hericium alpestre]|uniref:Uncharacterized protein n=1 Tax=Hericium alpestre TaxID=135208 RepID=A0A4Z0A091_9AGAM|nr:hypothetical protein EWM64_g3870 [Hericium alpestre]
MPPKPRMVRKNAPTSLSPGKPAPPPSSTTPTAASFPSTSVSKSPSKEGSMLPPPDPKPPQAILEPEVDMLTGCLKNIAVKTGQIYGFYADARRLGINKYAARPPQSLTAALGREVEKYDLLCDAMESHLLRAISVLQRDLELEKARIQAEAEAAALKESTEMRPSTPEAPATSAATSDLTAQPTLLTSSPMGPPAIPHPQTPLASPPVATPVTSARRPSTISLSTLNRPQFPHKLDLSAAALRINPEEISQGLASPVTLAPKSGRNTAASEFPPHDFMAALASSDVPANRPVDIDLTSLPDSESGAPQSSNDPALGSSADKPIELDLDSMDIDMSNVQDLFSDAGTGNMNIFDQGLSAETKGAKKEDDENLHAEILSALSKPDAVGHTDAGADIFASLGTNSLQAGTSNSQFPSSDIANSNNQPSTSSGPSASALLASFSASNAAASSSNEPQAVDGPEPAFDMNAIDFSSFSSLDAGLSFDPAAGADMNFMDMAAFMNMGDAAGNGNDNGNQGQSTT